MEKKGYDRVIRGSFRKLRRAEADITLPEHVIRVLVVGLAVAYSYILLN